MSVAPEFSLRSDPLVVAGTKVDCLRFEGGITSSSRTVLLLPGLASTGACFARQAPLASRWDLRCLTLPASRRPAADAVREYADLVAALAARFDRPVLLGTSFGGLVAIDAVSRMPDRFSGIALVSTFARWPAGAFARGAALALAFAGTTAVQWMAPFCARIAGGASLDGDTGAELCREAERFSRAERRRRLRAVASADLRDEAAAIDIPALVAHGTKDPVVPIAAGRELAHLLRRRLWCEIEGAAHVPYLTHAGIFNRQLEDFLRRIAPKRELQWIA